MKGKRFVSAVVVLPVLCAGCSILRLGPAPEPEPSKVTVRFIAPADPMYFAQYSPSPADVRMVLDESYTGFADEDGLRVTLASDSGPYHVVLWGGPYHGDDVTYSAASLAPGEYMFGLLDQDEGAVYQGWIGVNNSGDDLLDLLTRWRDTIHEQQLWLGFEYEADGKFNSRKSKHYKKFAKKLKKIRKLEGRLNKAVNDEMWARKHSDRQREEFLRSAEILLMPGSDEFFRPASLPTFSEAELAAIRSGSAMNKVVLMADHHQAVEKLRRLNNLRGDLRRGRTVLWEEVRRLERRKQFYMFTDHLYRHDKRFVENERRMQKALGMIVQIDQQMVDQRRHCLALMFINGLFSPGDALDAFEEEERTLLRERVVFEEQRRLIDLRFAKAGQTSFKRVGLERDRQNCIGEIAALDDQITRLGEARIAMRNLQDRTDVIHRHGPARMLTATLIDGEVPGYLVDAIERNALMTVRLQTTNSLYAPPGTRPADSKHASADNASWLR